MGGEVIGPGFADSKVKEGLLAVERRLGKLHEHDRRAVIGLRERYFGTSSLNLPDLRRLESFHPLADPAGTWRDKEIPF